MASILERRKARRKARLAILRSAVELYEDGDDTAALKEKVLENLQGSADWSEIFKLVMEIIDFVLNKIIDLLNKD
jgi:hypothetical protein